MANEISYQFQTQLRNGSIADSYASGSKLVTQTTAAMVRNVVDVGTTAAGEELDLGGVGTSWGWAVFVNNASVSSTEYLLIGTQVGGVFYPFLKLKYGEQQMVRLNAAPYAQSSAGTISLFYVVYAD